jgi:type IV secretory pathway TrbD component
LEEAMSVLVLLLAAAVPLTLVGVLVTVLVRSGRGSRPVNTPAATLVAARRHENVATALGLAGGLAVAVVLIALAGNGARLVPGAPGLAAALAPTAGALVYLGLLAVGERTWPRPVGAVRTAVLRRRTVREVTGRRLALLVTTAAVLVVALAAFALTADETGRAVSKLITAEQAAGGMVGGASGPYPGAPYALPILAALVPVLAATAWVLNLVARRPAVVGTEPDDDLLLRRTSARRVLAGAQFFVGATAFAVLVVGGMALGRAGWSAAGWAAALLGLAAGIVSLVAATNAFTPGDPSPRQTAVGVPGT